MSSVERMRSLADRIKNPRIAGLLRDALACVTERRHPDFRGLFGETGELIVCALSHAIGADASWLATGEHVYRSLENVYLQQARGADEATLRDCISFCTYGVLVGVYDREDFRYLVRISLSTRRDSTAIERHVRSAIVFLSAASEEQPRPFLSRVREWIDYTGISLCLPSDLAEEARSAGIDIDSVLQEEDFRLVSTLVRHPAYVDEATEGRRYVDLRQATQEWLPDSLSSEVLASCLRRAYSNAQREITSEDSVEDAIDKVEGVFIREGISSGPGSVLPINLHRLPAPPAIELSNTIVLELVPDRLRKSLLGSVVYSRKTRRIEVFFLAGTEIGRSGILVRTDTACILMDYGLSVANLRVPRWIPEIEMVDCVLVSHAHLDHVGGLPILYETYRGNWCSVGLTGPISSILLDDAMRVGMPTSSGRIPPEEPVRGVSAASLRRVMDSHVSLEYGKTAELAGGIMVTPIPASHIPGSAGFIIDIEGVRILYTGDFNAERSALFEGASLPTDCDLTIYDGTYWQREDFDRDRAAGQIAEVIADHGPVIIPSFAVGRAQEILLMLERMGITGSRNVIVAGMADRVTKVCGLSGRWSAIKKNKVTLEREDVLVSGGGMMSGGLAWSTFQEYRNDPDAAVILCGYLAPRTPGWNLLKGLESHACRVEYARLSAHTSSGKLEEWIMSCGGKRVMVHTPEQRPPPEIMLPRPGERISIDV